MGVDLPPPWSTIFGLEGRGQLLAACEDEGATKQGIFIGSTVDIGGRNECDGGGSERCKPKQHLATDETRIEHRLKKRLRSLFFVFEICVRSVFHLWLGPFGQGP